MLRSNKVRAVGGSLLALGGLVGIVATSSGASSNGQVNRLELTAQPQNAVPVGPSGSSGVVETTSGPVNNGRLRQMAKDEAARAGDVSPSNISVVKTTHGQASQILEGSGDPSDTTPVYIVKVNGSFTETDAPVPPGESPPAGSIMTLVVNANTGAVMDLGIRDTDPNLAAAGAVTALAP